MQNVIIETHDTRKQT